MASAFFLAFLRFCSTPLVQSGGLTLPVTDLDLANGKARPMRFITTLPGRHPTPSLSLSLSLHLPPVG